MSQYPQGPQQYGPPGYYYPPQPPPRKSSAPLILLVIAIFVVVVGVSAGVLVAIGRTAGDTPVAAATKTGTPTKTVDTTAEPEETEAPRGGTQRLGRTIELHGIQDTTVVRVMATRVIAGARPANQYITPKSGYQYIAVELLLKNVGEDLYNDAPTNSGKLIDADGQQYSATYAEVHDGVALNGLVTISSGDSRKGVLVFEVPRRTKLTRFQFVLNSGYGKDQGVWSIPG
ncbi:hypothetical protein Acor_18380 [Acrocarpospora corrugata]|uniref:DUF4352 domain-containing protein n=1 Tax=Acrocarpospora corrugata TaxID=35763 RepID=A0A5M3VSQ0_9ACTN|nr:DUF4352 domain-containing protein [Acrocarpospora corrugata]GER99774.1 hypothetical protein Acor_18380 [Acrocarpospora corrugata]